MRDDIPESLDATKIFHIHGWSAKPISRKGINWAGMTGQTKAFIKALKELPVGAKKFMPFKTMAGEIAYEVERVL